MKYAINWVIPHDTFYNYLRLIGSDHFKILIGYVWFKSKDIDYWSNGNKV